MTDFGYIAKILNRSFKKIGTELALANDLRAFNLKIKQ